MIEFLPEPSNLKNKLVPVCISNKENLPLFALPQLIKHNTNFRIVGKGIIDFTHKVARLVLTILYFRVSQRGSGGPQSYFGGAT